MKGRWKKPTHRPHRHVNGLLPQVDEEIVDDRQDGENDNNETIEKFKRIRDDCFFRLCKAGTPKTRGFVLVISIVLFLMILGYSPMVDSMRQSYHQEQEEEQKQVSTITPGLYTPPVFNFTPVPTSPRIACLSRTTAKYLRPAFENRGWTVWIDPFLSQGRRYRNMTKLCTSPDGTQQATIVWTKSYPRNIWNISQPWQRYNYLPFEFKIASKGNLILAQDRHVEKTGRKFDFLPDSYVLPYHHEKILSRLLEETVGASDGGGKQGTIMTGMDEPWVLKVAGVDRGEGIAILGPNSDSLHTFVRLLKLSNNLNESMSEIRGQLVFDPQVNKDRNPQNLKWLNLSCKKRNASIIFQRYVCNELDYYGHKFDLRVFWLAASVNPLVVFYHDGIVRVSSSKLNEKDFTATNNHLTNVARNRHAAASNFTPTAKFADLKVFLEAYVEANPEPFSATILQDPLMHIRNQIKDAIAELVVSVREVAFGGYRGNVTPAQDGFSLMGADFIVDRDLNVWITEAQSSPGFSNDTDAARDIYPQLLKSTVDILDEIIDKQEAGKPFFPMTNNTTGAYELIYTDDYQFQYDFSRRPLKRGLC